MSEPFLAEIRMFGLNFAVRSWAFCDGQLLPISQNSALFALLGTNYGGDGRTTFGLPDLRGRVPVHTGGNGTSGQGPGLSPYNLGAKGGGERVTLNVGNLPPHSHDVQSTLKLSNTSNGGTPPVAGDVVSSDGSTVPNALTAFVDAREGTVTTTIGDTGGGQSFDVRQPWLAVNFEIALQGIFPSRS